MGIKYTPPGGRCKFLHVKHYLNVLWKFYVIEHMALTDVYNMV